MIKLRPHHLACMSYFQGKGYSLDFTNNMFKVIDLLQKENKFMLVNEADSLCIKCPFNKNGVCKTEQKVSKFDDNYMKHYNLLNKEYSFDKIMKLVLELDDQTRLELCNDCEWTDICNNNFRHKFKFINNEEDLVK